MIGSPSASRLTISNGASIDRVGEQDQPGGRRALRRSTNGNVHYRAATAIGVALAAIYLLTVIRTMATTGYDIWGGVVIAPVVFVLGLPLLLRLLRKVEPDASIRRIVLAGFGAKLLGAYARFSTNEVVLGRGDAFVYHQYAESVSQEFRAFTFGGPAFGEAVTDFTGTEFIRLLLSGVYTISGPTRLGGYVVFSFVSFWGLYLFYRAFSIAVPDGLRRRYAVLVFFLPSMLFWPSSVGKEAWMTTMLGLGSYGLARLLAEKRHAYLPLLVALAGLGIVRPHVGAIFLTGLAVAFVVRRTSGTGRMIRKIVGLLVMAVAAGLLLAQLQSYFGLEEGLDASELFERTSERSAQGGSRFETTQPTGVADLPWAVITVLFRPFPYEAGSIAGLITSIEGTLLLGMFMWNAQRVARVPKFLITRPYVGYVVVYSLAFTFAFSAVSNFGILARQRTQLFPFVVVLLAIPIGTDMRPWRRIFRASPQAQHTLSVESTSPVASVSMSSDDLVDSADSVRPTHDPRFIG